VREKIVELCANFEDLGRSMLGADVVCDGADEGFPVRGRDGSCV